MTKRQVYFNTPTENNANRCIESSSIIINSTGVEYYTSPFLNGSTRLDYCLVYIINGEIDFYVKGEKTSLSKGGFLIGRPHKYKTYFGTTGSALNYYYLNFTGNRAESIVKEIGFNYNQAYDIGIHNSILECFEKIFDEFVIKDEFFELKSEASLITLLTEIKRKEKQEQKTHLKTVEYINRYYNKDLSVKFLADMEHLSCSYYYSTFKAIVGMSPQEYIITQRINAACFLLMDKQHSVSEVAELVGYTDQGYFSRIFKKKTGLSPKQYQNNNA